MTEKRADWKNVPEPLKSSRVFLQETMGNDLLQLILNIVQDGICILNTDLDILYANAAMDYWYGNNQAMAGHKCYEVYHNRKEPCTPCPALRSIGTGRPETDVSLLEKEGQPEGWQRLFCVPVLEKEGNVSFVVEYIRDTTDEKKAEASSRLVQQQNKILQEFLTQKDEEFSRREKKIFDNVNVLLDSMMEFLQNFLDTDSYCMVQEHLGLARQSLENMPSPLRKKLSNKELEIAEYIKNGYFSKEIAEKLNISKKTVDYHRINIRKKLGISSGENLQNYLKENL